MAPSCYLLSVVVAVVSPCLPLYAEDTGGDDSARPAPAPKPAGSAAEETKPAPPPDDRRARLERLERDLCAARLRLAAEAAARVRGSPAGAPPSPPALPTVEALMDALVRKDGAALHARLEPLLLRGPDGHAVLHAFFHRADIEHEKILTLTHDPQLLYALLRLAVFHPRETAELSRYLIRVTRERPQSFIRREVYNFVPVFLTHHEGCFPELRKELEDDIVFQIEAGGEYFYKVLYAMRELRFEPPFSAYLKLLESPRGQAMHASVIAHVASRGPDGLRVLARHVMEAPDPAAPSVRQALRSIGEKESTQEPEVLAPFLTDARLEVRRAARQGYFSRPRGASSTSRALEYLDAEDDPKYQRMLLSLIRRYSPGMMASLHDRAGEVRRQDLKETLLRESARRPPGTEAPEGAPAAIPDGPPAPLPIEGEVIEKRIARLEALIREEETAGAPAGPAAPAGPVLPMVTRDAGEAGARSRPGTGDQAVVAELRDRFERRDAPALAASLERVLGRGDAAHETLRDFLLEVDRKPIEEHATARSYQMSFALVHPIVRREAEVARFAHFFLEATRDDGKSAARAMIIEFLPVFVRYQSERFPDLRAYLERVVLEGLARGGEDLPWIYSVMDSLGFVPPIGLIEDRLVKAENVAEVTPLADHLGSRNDRDAVRAITRTLTRAPQFRSPRAAGILGALARMSVPEAEVALTGYLHSGNAEKRDAAALAYFSVERGERALPLALEYLNSPSALKDKSLWVTRIRSINPGLIELLRANLDSVTSDSLREALLEERRIPRPAPLEPAQR